MIKLMLFSSLILFSTVLRAQSCLTVLEIETDDALYPSIGEVQLCTDEEDYITHLRVIKPVKNPRLKDQTSKQLDERQPILDLSIDSLNNTKSDIVILTPRRMGIQVNAALISPPSQMISKKTGGELTLKVLKSKIANTYHHFVLKLSRQNNEWKVHIIKNKTATPVERLVFYKGLSGIKRVDAQ